MKCSYRELPTYLKWIPECLKKGSHNKCAPLNIHISTVTNWIPVSEWTFTGSLTFKCFSGNYAIMTDGSKDIKYSLDMFSKLVPYMKDKVVSGEFHYEPYGIRMLHYVPVLPEVLLIPAGNALMFSDTLPDKFADVS